MKFSRLLQRFGHFRSDADLEDELRVHLEMQADDNRARGVSRTEAERQARLQLGSPHVIIEKVRDQEFSTMLENWRRDTITGMRVLLKNPGFAATAIVMLALGIGANTAIFTVADALLLRSLPYPEPGRLVMVASAEPDRRDAGNSISFPNFTYLSEHSRSFSGLAAYAFENFSLTGHGDPEMLSSARVSGNFFDVLGIRPALGCTFLPDEDQPGGKEVVLISHRLWMRLFSGSPDAVGRVITLDSRDFTIAGVLPAGFTFAPLGSDVDIWAPRVFDLNRLAQVRRRVYLGGIYFGAIARLRPHVSPEQARAELEVLYRQYRRHNPGNYDAAKNLVMTVENLQDRLVANVRPSLLILAAAVGLVLLIACSNVAALLLSRGLGRKKEFAVRSALGASRATLIRQLLTESLLLAATSGAAGIALGEIGAHVLTTLAGTRLPRMASVHMNLQVLAFAIAISLISGLFFGLTPSLQLSKPDLNTILRDESRGTTGTRQRHNARNWLVVSQVALSMILLVGSGLLIHSFIRLRNAALGFDPKNVLTMRITLPPSKYGAPAQMIAFYNEALRQVRTLPGVEHAAISSALPLEPTHFTPALFEGQPDLSLGQRPTVNVQAISPDYARVMRIPLLAGREFTARDNANAPPVAIVNQTLVRRFWPGESPIGKRLWLGAATTAAEVVGVFGDTKNTGLAAAPIAEVCLPFPQLPWALLNLSLRTNTEPQHLISAVRDRILSIDKDQPITGVHTLEEARDLASAESRFMMILLGVFSATAFLLAIIGIYGVIAYSVAQRTQEFGIRMALGADRGDVFKLVIGQTLGLTLAGIAVGLIASLALSRVMTELLYQVSATDPVTFILSAALFAGVALAAGYLPARRAAAGDPIQALRAE